MVGGRHEGWQFEPFDLDQLALDQIAQARRDQQPHAQHGDANGNASREAHPAMLIAIIDHVT